ncbi:MAG: YggS family pyridoxal phosphate-dependent enzyme [Gammaproteobacteria bacterium]
MSGFAGRLAAVRRRIENAARAAAREPGAITVIGVTKRQPASAVTEALAGGLADFGENFVQEALEKMAAVDDPRARWHFIGGIQSNKTRSIAENFAWVHSIDRLKIARRLSDQRPDSLPPLNVCLQVHLGGEDTKSGAPPADIPALAAAVSELPRLDLRGLMAVPPPETDPVLQRAWFARLRELLEVLRAAGIDADVLSMGMSADLEAAVAEGATHVRIGTALFGPRS